MTNAALGHPDEGAALTPGAGSVAGPPAWPQRDPAQLSAVSDQLEVRRLAGLARGESTPVVQIGPVTARPSSLDPESLPALPAEQTGPEPALLPGWVGWGDCGDGIRNDGSRRGEEARIPDIRGRG
jgi:hypothetical protein